MPIAELDTGVAAKEPSTNIGAGTPFKHAAAACVGIGVEAGVGAELGGDSWYGVTTNEGYERYGCVCGWWWCEWVCKCDEVVGGGGGGGGWWWWWWWGWRWCGDWAWWAVV